MYSLREEIDRGKWVVQGDWIFLNHWTTPLPVGASLLATSRAHRSWPKRLRHLWASSAGCPRDPATTGLMKREVPRDPLCSAPGRSQFSYIKGQGIPSTKSNPMRRGRGAA